MTLVLKANATEKTRQILPYTLLALRIVVIVFNSTAHTIKSFWLGTLIFLCAILYHISKLFTCADPKKLMTCVFT